MPPAGADVGVLRRDDPSQPSILRSTRVPTHSRDGWLSASSLHLAVDPEAGVQDGDVGR